MATSSCSANVRGILAAASEVRLDGFAPPADGSCDSAGITIRDVTWRHDSNGLSPVATSAQGLGQGHCADNLSRLVGGSMYDPFDLLILHAVMHIGAYAIVCVPLHMSCLSALNTSFELTETIFSNVAHSRGPLPMIDSPPVGIVVRLQTIVWKSLADETASRCRWVPTKASAREDSRRNPERPLTGGPL